MSWRGCDLEERGHRGAAASARDTVFPIAAIEMAALRRTIGTMTKPLLTLLFLGPALSLAGETLYFEVATPEETTRVSLYIEGEDVSGIQTWEVPDAHGTQGSLEGKAGEEGILRLRHDYTIEGSDQSEEVIYKLQGDTLHLGEGELVETNSGLLKLKDPSKVEFTKTLKRIKVEEPQPGSPVRKEIMEAMRGPVSAYIGKAVEFTGEVAAHQGWALFSGNVAPEDGKAPSDPDAQFSLELDFAALLKKDPEGHWQMLDWGFSGDIGVREGFREKFPSVPWVLLP